MDYKARKDPNSGFQISLLDYFQEEEKSSPLEKKIMPLGAADTLTPPQHADSVIFTSSFVLPLPQIPVNVESHLPTIFGRVPERCVTFCIDTSGSMFHALDIVKGHLIETLSMLAEQDDNRLFNVIEFNTDVTKWSNKMVHCTPETVAAAKQWVSNLAVKAGTNTQEGLLSALSDPACQAIYLVTDDIPDRYTEEIVTNIVDVCGCCRIHCIYISGEEVNEDAVEFLEDLAVETCGSVHIVTLTCHGCVDRITPIYRADHSRGKLVQTLKSTLQSSLKTCSIPTTLQFDPEVVLGKSPYPKCPIYHPFIYLKTLPHYLRPYLWPRLHSRNISLKEDGTFSTSLFNFSSSAGSLLAGKKVVARRKQDGYFYKATVKNQVSRDTFLVAFPPCRHYNLYQTEYEDVSVFDIVDCTTTQNRTISTGDRVLTPCDTEEDRFAPGVVVKGRGRQAEETYLAIFTVAVCFTDGQVKQVPEEAVVLIPPVVHDKFTQQKQMPMPSNYPTMDSKIDCRVSPLAVKSNSYLWDSLMYRHPYFLPLYPGCAQFITNQKEGLDQGIRKDISNNLDPPLRATNRKDQNVMQEYQLNYKESSEKVAGGEIYPEKAGTFFKIPRLPIREENQKEAHLRNLVLLNSNEENLESKPGEITNSSIFGHNTSGSQVQKMYLGKGDDSAKYFIPSPGYENEKILKKVSLCNYNPNSSEHSVSSSETVKNSACVRPVGVTTPRLSLKMGEQKPLYRDVEVSDTKVKPTSQDCLISNNFKLTNETSGERIQTNKGKRYTHLLQPETQQKELVAKKDSRKMQHQEDVREIILNQMEKDRQTKIQEEVNFQQAHLSRKKINSALKSKIIAY